MKLFGSLARLLAAVPVEEGLSEAERKEKVGREWDVVLIESGLSVNRNLYSEDVLRQAAPLYEGRPVFWGHTREANGEPDPRRTAGVIRKTRYEMVEGKGAIVGRFRATDPKAREVLLEAADAEALNLFGLSHVADVEAEAVRHSDGRPALRVSKINAVESTDLVSFPSAGGRVLRVAAGGPMSTDLEEILMNFEAKLKKVKESALAAHLSATPSEAEVDALLRVLEAQAQATPPPPPATPVADKAAATPAMSDADRSLLQEFRQGQRSVIVESALRGVNLPEPLLVELREGLLEREGLTAETAKAAVEKKVAIAAKLEESRGIGFGAGTVIEGGADAADKALHRLDDLLMTDATPATLKAYEALAGRKAGRPDSYSVRECYVAITGDRRPVGGQLTRESAVKLDRYRKVLDKRVVEGRRLVEASALLTTTWAEIFGDSVARRMLAEYRSDAGMDAWRLIASVVPLNDFRTQHRVRWGGFGDLSTVSQDADYQVLSAPQDEEVTYAAAKRGNFFDLSWESMVNDDLGQVRNIPIRMGRAAARTLYKFVTSTLVAANPTMDYDSVALFAAGHSNIITSPLSASQISVARQKMAAQTDMSTNEKLNLYPSWLMVPVELEETGWRIVNVPVANTAGQTGTEPSYQRSIGLNTLIVNPYLSDTNNWFVGCDKGSCPIVEIGFLFGQEEPTIVIADAAAVDPYFIADRIRYKIRHVYGGDAVDHRGVVGGVVA